MPGIAQHSPNSNPQEAQVSAGLLASLPFIRRALDAGIELLFPPRCAGCGRVDYFWCPRCRDELNRLPVVVMVRAEPIAGLQQVASTEIHRGLLREAVQGLKYGSTRLLREPLGERLVTCSKRLDWTIDMIVPVPLHTKRLKERGYNQAQLLAEYAASHLSIPCRPEALLRAQYTESQVGLGAQERRTNVADAFQSNPELVTDRTLLLVDDVCTTGATLSACARAVLDAGAKAVYGLTVTTASM